MKIIIVDDHQVLLDSLESLINSMDNIEVVACLKDPRNVEIFLDNHQIDILVSDFNMPHMSGVDLCLSLKSKFPDLKVLLLTMVEDADQIRDAIRAGVSGYILKKTGKDELQKAINQIYHGSKYYSEDVLNTLLLDKTDDLNDNKPQNIENLTQREIEVLKLIAVELSTFQISEKLFLSIKTIETHRASLMKKLKTKSSIGMVKYALKHGLIEN